MNSSYLLLNGLRFHYLYWNLGGGNRPIVCHHGLASNARIWEMVAPRLAEQGYGVYSLDARGHGLTDKPDDGYDIATVTQDLAAFVDACHLEHPILLGHSWGANVILNYAARFAVGPRAPAAIVLVDGGIVQLDELGIDYAEMERNATPPSLAGMPMDEFVAKYRAWNAAWQPSDQAVSIELANFEVSDDERIYPRLPLDHHMQIFRSIWEFKSHDTFSKVRCPALVLLVRPASIEGGERRWQAAKERGIERARQSIRSLDVKWMENSIHDLPLQRPQDLSAAISEFISTRLPAQP